MAQSANQNEKNTRITTETTMDRDCCYYNMNRKKQGLAYIFFHEEFQTQPKRNAAKVEAEKLESCLSKLGFDVQRFRDLKLAEIQFHINQAARETDHTNSNCFLVAVLTHGDQNKVSAYDKFYRPNEVLWDQFTADKCSSLAGKPKLFILQCCQGEQVDPGVELVYTPQRTETDAGNTSEVTDGNTITDGRQAYTIPLQSDFCIVYATARGHFAFRHEYKGSCFIRFLCEELEKHAYNEHLLTILTFVIRRVTVEFESKTRETGRNKKKQAPYFESSLTRILKFVNKNNKTDGNF